VPGLAAVAVARLGQPGALPKGPDPVVDLAAELGSFVVVAAAAVAVLAASAAAEAVVLPGSTELGQDSARGGSVDVAWLGQVAAHSSFVPALAEYVTERSSVVAEAGDGRGYVGVAGRAERCLAGASEQWAVGLAV
jgi:hypothetical protein